MYVMSFQAFGWNSSLFFLAVSVARPTSANFLHIVLGYRLLVAVDSLSHRPSGMFTFSRMVFLLVRWYPEPLHIYILHITACMVPNSIL